MNGQSDLRVILCSFEGGRFRRKLVAVHETPYVAISHAWGFAEWQLIEGIEEEVLVSKIKAKFIKDHLPQIVGDLFFGWMFCASTNAMTTLESP